MARPDLTSGSESPKKRALIVDDDVHVRALIARWLADDGFDCLQAENGRRACEQIRDAPVDLITLDVALPARGGGEMLDEIFAISPDAVVLMVTATQEARAAIDVLRRGASGYLMKPVSREQLLLQVRKSLAQRQMLVERRRYTARLEEQSRQQTVAIRRAHEETIHRLVAASSCRDVESSAHILRTGLMCEALARGLGWSAVEAEQIRLAAPMHDVGKIGIPDAILRKAVNLTRDEFEIMKSHTTIGANMLEGSDVPMLQMAREIALAHHERWNGRGYPFGLAGDAIPVAARIMGLVDAYDSLTHDRVYKTAMPEAEAAARMRRDDGQGFDPEHVAAFLDNLAAIREIAAGHPDEPRDDKGGEPKCLAGELASLAACV